MKQLTLQIQESKYPFFLELMHSFDFVSFRESAAKTVTIEVGADSVEDIVKNVQQGVEEVKLINQGKLQSRPARELINEL
ncbi:hypothetical protein FACS1894199_07980 [Bacteroidia bacterium]|nr:hypothetical protein FACS1894199_07980 [Bacteroidia bacterium]